MVMLTKRNSLELELGALMSNQFFVGSRTDGPLGRTLQYILLHGDVSMSLKLCR